MRTLAVLGIALGAAAAPCFAEHLNGKLMDAQCYNQKQVARNEEGVKTHGITEVCAATKATTQFAVHVTGAPYREDVGDTIKLDDSGNTIAAQQIRANVLPANRKGEIKVQLNGKMMPDLVLATASVDGD